MARGKGLFDELVRLVDMVPRIVELAELAELAGHEREAAHTSAAVDTAGPGFAASRYLVGGAVLLVGNE
jgi:hypothetical protein